MIGETMRQMRVQRFERLAITAPRPRRLEAELRLARRRCADDESAADERRRVHGCRRRLAASTPASDLARPSHRNGLDEDGLAVNDAGQVEFRHRAQQHRLRIVRCQRWRTDVDERVGRREELGECGGGRPSESLAQVSEV